MNRSCYGYNKVLDAKPLITLCMQETEVVSSFNDKLEKISSLWMRRDTWPPYRSVRYLKCAFGSPICNDFYPCEQSEKGGSKFN